MPKRINKEINDALARAEKAFGKPYINKVKEQFKQLISQNGGEYDIMSSRTNYSPGEFYTYLGKIKFANGITKMFKVSVGKTGNFVGFVQ